MTHAEQKREFEKRRIRKSSKHGARKGVPDQVNNLFDRPYGSGQPSRVLVNTNLRAGHATQSQLAMHNVDGGQDQLLLNLSDTSEFPDLDHGTEV
jgi:hypothetical protein